MLKNSEKSNVPKDMKKGTDRPKQGAPELAKLRMRYTPPIS